MKCYGTLTHKELEQSKSILFACIQKENYPREITALTMGKSIPRDSIISKLNPFLDKNGLLRIKGRLDHTDLSYESKHPIRIPPAKLLVCFQHCLLKHAGVSTLISTLRSCYWIVGLRKIAKSICRECIYCRRHHAQACKQTVSPLPKLRVTSAPPFTVTGVDFAGPLFCVDYPSKKFCILLFTCAVVCAVHLELTNSISQTDCLLAVRRFAARRGLPNVIYSDNAKTFVSVSNQLQQYFGPHTPQWKFIVPYAPWWGGWWERLIRSVKLALRKTLCVKCLTRSELKTTLHEIEACVNSRPLTFAGEDCDASHPLTPSHFLIGRTAGFQVEVNDNQLPIVSSKDLNEREHLRQQQLDKFWKLWMSDYIRNLPPTIKDFVSRCNLRKGSMVLVREDNAPRLQWPLGVVTELFPGKDGVLRSVSVKTAKGIFCRPVQRVHSLEFSSRQAQTEDPVSEELCTDIVQPDDSSASVDVCSSDTTQPNVYHTRTGRAVKPPVRLDYKK